MSIFRHRTVRFALSGLLLPALLAGSALAAPAGPGGREAPSFADLLAARSAGPARASPLLAASAAEVQRAQGLALQARARPNPTVGLTAENIAGSAPLTGTDRAETTFQWSQPIELGAKRQARIAAAQAEVGAEQARDHAARVDYAYALALAYGRAEAAQRRIALAEDEVEEGENDLRAATLLVKAGRESQLRAIQAESALAKVRADLIAARADALDALARLAALAGTDETWSGIGVSLLDQAAPAPTPAQAAPLMGPPDPAAAPATRLAAAQEWAARQELAAQQRARLPDITVNVGARRLSYEQATAFVAGISLPLPLFDRNKGRIAASQAQAQAAAARAVQARLDVEASGRAALGRIEAADARLLASRQGLASAEEAYRLARIAYDTGKASLLELLSVRHGLGEARGLVLDAGLAALESRAALARLHGRAVTGDLIP